MESRNSVSVQQLIAALIQAGEIESLNYNPAGTPPFAAAGTRLDLINGNIQTTALYVDGTTGDLSVRGDVTADSLTLLDDLDVPRMVFDEMNVPGVGSGSGFRYLEPTWVDPTTRTGIFSTGSSLFGDDRASTNVFAETTTAGGLRKSFLSVGVSNADDQSAILNAGGAQVSVSRVLGSIGAFIDAASIIGITSVGAPGVIDLSANTLRYQGVGFGQIPFQRVWQGAGTPNIALNAGSSFRYWRLGPLCFVFGIVGIAGAGTAGQRVACALPLAPINGNKLGTIEIQDQNTGTRYCGLAEFTFDPGYPACYLVDNVTGFNAWGAVPAIALAAGDNILLNLCYEVAG